MQYSGIVSGGVKPPLVDLIADNGSVVSGRNGFFSTTSYTYFIEGLTSSRDVAEWSEADGS